MGWKGWIARAAGIGLSPFTGGASIPIGFSVGSALDASDASKGAAKTQVESAHKAIAYQQPYMDAGSAAINRLNTLMTPGGGAMSSMATPSLQAVVPQGTTPEHKGILGRLADRVVAIPVTMRAPDGSMKDVPASEVAHWQQMGATVVSGAPTNSAGRHPAYGPPPANESSNGY